MKRLFLQTRAGVTGSVATAAACLSLLCASSVSAQSNLCSGSHSGDLYCLIPATFHTAAAPFNALFTPFGTQLSELPTARPAGAILGFENGALVSVTENGTIFSERPESVGKNRIFAGFTYQNFHFSYLDSLNLKSVPIVLYYPPNQVYTSAQSRFDVRVGQYALVAAAGLTSRIDVSIAVPFERVSLATTVSGTEYGPSGATAAFNEHVPGTSSGLADVVIGGKGLLLDLEKYRVAVGTDVRLPTGDELNFLGSGTLGVRPYLAASRTGTFSPHLNVGYQWNGNSILNPTAGGAKQQLPTDFFYAAGLNITVGKRVTLTQDLLGKRYFDAPRLSLPTLVTIPGAGSALSVQPYTAGYTQTDLSLGFKAKVVSQLLVTGNVLLKMNDGGLRAQAVPLLEVSYSF